jgi:hypothetical protein
VRSVGCECIVIGKGLEVFENRSRNLDVQILYGALVYLDRKIAIEKPDTLSSYLALLEVRNVFEFWTSCYLASHINSLFHSCCNVYFFLNFTFTSSLSFIKVNTHRRA